MALSANATITLRNVTGQKEGSMVINTSSVVYKGGLMVCNDAGTKLLPAANSATTMFLGIAKTGPLTGDGTVTCEYIYDVDCKMTSSGITAGDIGIMLYAKDDATVCNTATLGPKVGVMAAYDATNSVWLWVRGGGLMGKAS